MFIEYKAHILMLTIFETNTFKYFQVWFFFHLKKDEKNDFKFYYVIMIMLFLFIQKDNFNEVFKCSLNGIIIIKI